VEPIIVAGNLSYPNLPPSTGNSVSFYPGPAKGARLNLNGVIVGPAAKAYYSFVLKITGISNSRAAEHAGPHITHEVAEDNNRIVRIEDTGAGSLGTTVAAAGANQNFRGIRFGPSESPVLAAPTLSFARAGTDLILSWSGAFVLQSAGNVTGPY